MTVQPTFSFSRHRREVAADDADRLPEETTSDGEKPSYPPADRTPSVSSFNSDDKQTFGVSKVEAITTVWTKKALITLYILYVPHGCLQLTSKYFPCLFRQFHATADHGTISAVRHECIQFTFSHSCHWNCLQHHDGGDETPPRQNPRCVRSI